MNSEISGFGTASSEISSSLILGEAEAEESEFMGGLVAQLKLLTESVESLEVVEGAVKS